MRGIVLALLLAAADAAAHGGGFPHANGVVPPGLRDPGPAPGFQDPRVPCACAGKCWLCSDGDGRVVDRVATHFWNDFAAVRIDIRRGPRSIAVHPSRPPS